MSVSENLQKIVVLCVVVVAVVGGWWYFSGSEDDGAVVCTAEAKLCPDGSYVGRTGPNCEFAVCPSEGDTVIALLGKAFMLKEGQTAVISGTDLEVTVTKFFNNPCPVDVRCVWSGIGIGFRYSFGGKTAEGTDLVKAFGFQTTIVDTDYETFAQLVVERVDNVTETDKKKLGQMLSQFEEGEFRKGFLIVSFDQSISSKLVETILRSHSLVMESWHEDIHVAFVVVPDGQEVSFARILLSAPEVVWVEPDRIVTIDEGGLEH